MSVALPPLAGQMASAWDAIFDICDATTDATPWTLVGGQMVYLHAIENGAVPPRTTVDADVLVDVRLAPTSTRAMATMLQGLGFDLEGAVTSGVAHRFRRNDAIVDVLAPEGLGGRASLVTVPPGTTVSAPGGTHALQRTSATEVSLDSRTAAVPRPDLLGAILIKAAAVARISAQIGDEKHKQDLALLLGLVSDPLALMKEVSKGARRVLTEVKTRMPISEPAWRSTPTPDAAFVTLEVLASGRGGT